MWREFDMWWLYVVRCADDTLYTGVTKDVVRRLHEHNSTGRGAKYTRARRPVTLVYKRKYPDRSAAQIAEHSFKWLSRYEKLKRIKEHNQSGGE